MKRLVLGTAGHIDHGKTALVRALTGVDTDRLAQEKERGITIELGFTHLALPSGVEAGFVDVPGHERFVRTMIAGAWGLDLVLLVIAADEGVMPQTREHLDICQLLGVRRGIIVLNKIDLVDEEMIALSTEDATDSVAGTFLEGAPVISFSAVTGAGKDELLQAMDDAVRDVEPMGGGPFRLPVDRVFTMKGFGTVVTGTSAGGTLRVGDSLQVYPKNESVRVRGIQVHERDTAEAHAGQRTAINLGGVDRGAISRGDVLAEAGAVKPSFMLDVEYIHLRSAPKDFAPKRIRFLVGTSEALGTIHFLDAKAATPGQTHLAQIRLDAPVCVRPEDRFVVRTYSPMITVGGGRVLDSVPRKHKTNEEGVGRRLKAMATGDMAARAQLLVEGAGAFGLTVSELRWRLPPSVDATLPELIAKLIAARKLEQVASTLLLRAAFDKIAGGVTTELKAFHREHPEKPGMARGALASAVGARVGLGGPQAPILIGDVFRALEESGTIAADGAEVRLPSHHAQASGELAAMKDQVEQQWARAGLSPPSAKEVAERLSFPLPRVKEVVGVLVREGALVRAKEDLYFHRDPLAEIQVTLVAWLEKNGKITTLEFKTMAGVSRKYMIPLLEHFDAAKVTMRVGDARVLRGAK